MTGSQSLDSETNHYLVIAADYVDSIFADSKERVLALIHDLEQENLALHDEVSHQQMQKDINRFVAEVDNIL